MKKYIEIKREIINCSFSWYLQFYKLVPCRRCAFYGDTLVTQVWINYKKLVLFLKNKISALVWLPVRIVIYTTPSFLLELTWLPVLGCSYSDLRSFIIFSALIVDVMSYWAIQNYCTKYKTNNKSENYMLLHFWVQH